MTPCPPGVIVMSHKKCRSVFLSDVHLGTPDCKASYLLDFLHSIRCEHLYLVGDIIDLESLARRRWWHPDHGRVLQRLFDIAQTDTRVTYIPGNHDAPLRRLAGRRIAGIEISLDAVHVGADGRRYRVSHGDEFDFEHAGRSWMYGLGDALHRLACWSNRRVHAWRQWRNKPYLPWSIIVKSHLQGAMNYIRGYEQRVIAYAREAGFDGHICGHIHFGRVHQDEGVLYLNDGDWVEHCTALVEDATGAMELLHWSEASTALGRASREIILPSPSASLSLAPFAEVPLDLARLRRAA